MNFGRLLYNFSPFRLFSGPMIYYQTESLIDIGKMIQLLCTIQGNQVFDDGLFNDDCHPGNILLLTDGRLGLIDYGQVKRMCLNDRIMYAKLILAHNRMDKNEVVRIHFDEMGIKTKHMKPDIGYLMSAFYNDRSTPDICGTLNVSEFVDWLQLQDPLAKGPDEFVMLVRVSIFMRGMGKAFGLNLRMSDLWRDEAKALLDKHGVDY